jgi:hypothetical protein
MRSASFPHRGHWRILHFVPYNTVHDSALHSTPVHGLRIHVQSHESNRTLRPIYTLLRGRNRRWFRCGAYHAFGRHQDITANARKRYRCRVEECVWPMAGSEDHTPKRRIQRIFPRIEAQNHHHNAQHGHLLVSSATTLTFTSIH